MDFLPNFDVQSMTLLRSPVIVTELEIKMKDDEKILFLFGNLECIS